MKTYRVSFRDPATGEYDSLLYVATSRQEAAAKFFDETGLCHRSVDEV